MTSIQKAIDILRRSEGELRVLVSEAVQLGEYGSVMALTQIAQELKGLSARVGQPELAGSASSMGRVAAEAAGAGRVVGGYPKFYRHGKDLVKVAWSKKEREEYVHKATKESLADVLSALEQVGAGGKTFTAEELIAAAGRDRSSPVPAFQTYVALAWLRKEGLVQRHGREGYSIVRGEDIRGDSEARWSTLAPWRAK